MRHLSHYRDETETGIVSKVRQAVQSIVDNVPEDRVVTINLNLQINYARGGGATVNVRNK